MVSSSPCFRDVRRSILDIVALSMYFSLVYASQLDMQVNIGECHWGLRAMQDTLAIPTLPSEVLFAGPLHRPTATSYISSDQLSESPCSSQSRLSQLDSAGETFPQLPVAESAEEDSPNPFLVMAYYPDWIGATLPPSKIDLKRFDWIDFAFAVPAADLTLKWDDPDAPKMLRKLVDAAHDKGTKVKLSVGGWTGSDHFSSAVATNKSRSTLVHHIAAIYTSFGIDGIDIDWEYPGKEGASHGHFHYTDTANFLSFLQLLRAKLPPAACISAAVETTTFVGETGEPESDLTEFAEVLDWVLLMNYDVWGSSRDPGPNAPLHDACNNSTQPNANAVSAYNAWTAANFPAHKLILGLPSYGYVSSSTVERLRTRSEPPSGQTSNFTTAAGNEDGGQIQFRELIEQGIIVRSTNQFEQRNTAYPVFTGSGGFERLWDACSDTPYLRSSSSGQVITYDDPESLAMKAAFAKAVGMGGVNLFDASGDTEQWDLIDTVRRSIT